MASLRALMSVGTPLRKGGWAAAGALAMARRAAAASTAVTPDGLFAGADATQVEFMKEEIIIVDEHDRVLHNDSRRSKKETHLWPNIQAGLLHRAFSVFLFDEAGRLLVQRRSPEKITFPLMWANTCCSHPLYGVGQEMAPHGEGAKHAARRKLAHELGIPAEDVPLDSFLWMTRVHYVASQAGGVWGEHEMDHVLICKPPPRREGGVQLALNDNEVARVDWIPRDKLASWIAAKDAAGEELSQWFRLISTGLLPRWWEALEADTAAGLPLGAPGGALAALVEPDVVYRARTPDAKALVREPLLA